MNVHGLDFTKLGYDPSNDTAGITKVYDKYVQATASVNRPDIDSAIKHATDLADRLARVRDYWKLRKAGAKLG